VADPINSPAHYTYSSIEPIHAIEAWKLGYNLGCCVKYIARADHKGSRLMDLQKARWYLDREIAGVQPAVSPAPTQSTIDEWVSALPTDVADNADVVGVQFIDDGRDGDVLIVKNKHGAVGERITRAAWGKRYADTDELAVLVRRDELPQVSRNRAARWLEKLGEQPRSERDINTDTVKVFGTIEDRICHLLNGQSQEVFTVDQIEASTGVERKSLCSCLSRLLRRGVIARPARGVYCSRRNGRVGSSRG
jgi:Protein of unknwon function (DUF3310)/Transcriptional regulator, AbiEi antitoxin